MRYLVSATVLSLTLLACGTDDSEPEPASKTVKDVCASVETVLPEDDAVEEVDWTSFLSEVNDLAESADEEANNALDELRPGVQAMIDDAQGDTALFELSDSLVAFKDRCVAAGSSAFAS